MPIKSLEKRKRQQILLIVGLCILIVAALVLYFGFWKGESMPLEEISLEEERELPEQDQRTAIVLEEKLKKIDLDFGFLKETILPFLKSHGDLPVKKGEAGRANPFIPY